MARVRSPRKILPAILSSRRRSIPILFFFCSLPSFEKPNALRTDRRWLRFHLFARQCPEAFRDRNLRARYLETTELASSYTYYLDSLNGARRLDEIRRFRSLDYSDKKKRILALPGAEISSRRVNLICEN